MRILDIYTDHIKGTENFFIWTLMQSSSSYERKGKFYISINIEYFIHTGTEKLTSRICT